MLLAQCPLTVNRITAHLGPLYTNHSTSCFRCVFLYLIEGACSVQAGGMSDQIFPYKSSKAVTLSLHWLWNISWKALALHNLTFLLFLNI